MTFRRRSSFNPSSGKEHDMSTIKKTKTGRSNKMKAYTKVVFALLIILNGAVFGQSASDAPYESLKGLTGLEVAFDLRLDSPKKTALFLKLIHMTYKDKDLANMAAPPRFVVVFNGESVTLISEDKDRFAREDRVFLQEIANRITLMAKDGIKLEGCVAAATIFNVDPESFLSEIEDVNNAWISLAGYQAQQISVIPIY
jgi:intracellular sulfur oxidation DsrE/DsrF family protein